MEDSEDKKLVMCKNGKDSSSLFSIQAISGKGRCLITEQDIQPKDVLLEEFPLVSAPSGQTDVNAETQEPYEICIGCYLSLRETADEMFPCTSCGWPFCSEDCFNEDVTHKRMECQVFKENRIMPESESLRAVYFLRCIHLSRSPDQKEIWTKIQYLSASYDQNGRGKEVEDKDRIIHNYLQTICGLTDLSLQLVADLNGRRTVNAFQINYCELESKRYYGMALYAVSSLAAHACNPNCRWRTVKPEEKPGYPIRLEASDIIEKDHLVTVAYRNKCLTTGTLHRRQELLSGHGFLCQCDRCGDPTEFGTNFSAIHCTHCAVGYLLPEDSLDPKSPWGCKTCGGLEEVDYLHGIMDRITMQIHRAKEGKCKASETCCKLDIIIRQYSDRVLHPNNYLVVWAEFLWLQFLEYNLFILKCSSLKYDIFKMMTSRAEHCREIYSKFFSKHTRFYGYFEKLIGLAHYLYYLSAAVWDDLSDKQRLRIMRGTLTHFENALIYDGWDGDELQFIEAKLRHIKYIVTDILRRAEVLGVKCLSI